MFPYLDSNSENLPRSVAMIGSQSSNRGDYEELSYMGLQLVYIKGSNPDYCFRLSVATRGTTNHERHIYISIPYIYNNKNQENNK